MKPFAMRVLVCLAVFTACNTGQTPAIASEWKFELTPYMWMAGLKGDILAKRGGTVEVNAIFSDVFNYLDIGLMGSLEARNGRWSLFFDGLYVKLSDSQPTTRRGWGNVDSSVTQQMYTLGVGYRLVEGQTNLDVLGGARYSNLNTDLNLTPGLFPGRRAERTADWWDPFIGLRAQYHFTHKLSLVAYGDVGGFDVGAKFAWQGVLGLNYQFTENLVGKIGYRYLYTDYEKDDFTYDMAMGGVYVGLGIQF